MEAIFSIHGHVVYWSSVAKREAIGKSTEAKYEFPLCVMVGNGSLFPLNTSLVQSMLLTTTVKNLRIALDTSS